jgi:hypothetical protein
MRGTSVDCPIASKLTAMTKREEPAGTQHHYSAGKRAPRGRRKEKGAGATAKSCSFDGQQARLCFEPAFRYLLELELADRRRELAPARDAALLDAQRVSQLLLGSVVSYCLLCRHYLELSAYLFNLSIGTPLSEKGIFRE